ncbi:type IV pilin protein [Vibrio sp. LaRot3]|uniref:type IV pilin protein n=1 Tax=Vibrio sp. LaRot3 TaxID=2998829 RepID=UPI0022CE001B|nr:type IV pilin protein [Vibrio sp. LaRot3]MDA0149234.1 prepilin-type N-terminal cleavage/methylation domain-containing protein [Vibrio sp. LaRot3]
MSLKLICKPGKKKLEAMTLIELLIVVAIVGILATFAYPSFQSHIINANRTVAMSDLSKIQLYLENGYDGSYVSAANSVMAGGSCGICESDSNDYSISISAGTSSYTIEAKPLNQQTKDTCLSTPNDVITLKQTGKGQPLDCWG